MATHLFNPRLDILPPPQLSLWQELTSLPSHFVLWGGTGLALHLGHRQSIDFDFFSDISVDFDELLQSVPFLHNAIVTQRTPGTFSCIVDRDGPVKLSFFAVPGVLHPTQAPVRAINGVAIAALIDIAAMKVKVVADRAEMKDYIDIDAILSSGRASLAEALDAAVNVYGRIFNPLPSLKALTYFGDGNLAQLPDDIKQRLQLNVRAIDLSRFGNEPA